MTVTTYTGRVIDIRANNQNNPNSIIVVFVDDTDGQTKTLVLDKYMFDVNAGHGEIEHLGPEIGRVMHIVNQYFAPADTTMTFTIHEQNHVTLNLSCDDMNDGAYGRTGVKVVLSDYYDVPVFAFV